MSFDGMTPAQIIEESRRRLDRRAKGLPLSETTAEKAERLQEEDHRAEKAIQAEVVKLFRAYGCTVYSLSQPRATMQSVGVPDLIVFHRRLGHHFYFETKTPSGKQSSAQEEFELDCTKAGIRYVCGGIAAAENELIRIGAAERLLSGTLDVARTPGSREK